MLYFQLDWHILLEKWFGFYILEIDWIVYKGLFYTIMEADLREFAVDCGELLISSASILFFEKAWDKAAKPQVLCWLPKF